MFVSKLPSNKNRGSPESFSLKILEYSYPQCHRHRRLLESDNYRGDQSVTNVPVTERPDQCLCLPNNVLHVTKSRSIYNPGDSSFIPQSHSLLVLAMLFAE